MELWDTITNEVTLVSSPDDFLTLLSPSVMTCDDKSIYVSNSETTADSYLSNSFKYTIGEDRWTKKKNLDAAPYQQLKGNAVIPLDESIEGYKTFLKC